MQTDTNAKQQIVEKIKSTTNILVTVGNNPSVDELSAALSLTLMLNRLDKHATAVFSGQVPAAINFLEPDKTFENSVDSLRDFIIALDKEKADRLRYKVEDDVVRIFITPYKTVISEKDLQFSQGDFNVETIIALGVEKREDLDAAITAHGRILHDASVITINSKKGEASLGSVDWTDESASSLCEMLMSLSEALQSGLLDQQIATALLTGIVSATDRFRNEHTTPRVMTMAAQLMAAGANQQLIAAKLEEGHELAGTNGTTSLTEGASQKIQPTEDKQATNGSGADGALQIAHAAAADQAPQDPSADALKEAEAELAKSLEQNAPAAAGSLQSDLAAAAAEEASADTTSQTDAPAPEDATPAQPTDDTPRIIKPQRSWQTAPTEEPAFGGTLNATTEEAEAAKREEAMTHENHQILSHDVAPATKKPAPATPEPEPVPEEPAPMPAPEEPAAPVTPEPTPEPTPAPELPPVPTFEPAEPTPALESTEDAALSFEPAPIETPSSTTSGPTLAEIDSHTRGKAADEARAAIDAALNSMPFNPAGQPVEAAGATPVFELQHDQPATSPVPESALPPLEETPSAPPAPVPLPPLPDFSTLPPLPGDAAAAAPPAVEPPTATPPADPGQFKIPGQS